MNLTDRFYRIVHSIPVAIGKFGYPTDFSIGSLQEGNRKIAEAHLRTVPMKYGSALTHQDWKQYSSTNPEHLRLPTMACVQQGIHILANQDYTLDNKDTRACRVPIGKQL